MKEWLDIALVAAVGVWALAFLWRRHARRRSGQGGSCGRCEGGTACPGRQK